MWNDKLTTAGGSIGGVVAYFLRIEVTHVVEVGLYALVGALVGEGVKEGIKFLKKKL